MPSANRFALLRDTARNHPVVVASSAASVGVLLGAFVAVQLLATPQLRDSAPAAQATIAAKPQVAVATKVEAKPVPETTGSAPSSVRTASADCDQETWPHLSPLCVEEMRSKHRSRVISTDKPDKPAIGAIEASSPAPVEAKPAAPVVADTAPVSSSPSPVDLTAAPSAVFAAPDPSPATVTSVAPPPSPPTANAEAKKEKRFAMKSKRKPKAESKAPAKQEFGDDDATSVASDDADDRASDGRADRRSDRRRIVERRTEQDYDVPATNGDGQRRVIVIRRSGGGLFESLFGN